MTDANEKTEPRSKTQRILDELNAGEALAARVAAKVAVFMSLRPHLALALFIGYTIVSVYVGHLIGKP